MELPKQCQKIGYPDRSQAKQEAKEIRHSMAHFNRTGKLRKDPKKLRPYRCPSCEQWHLTTSKRRAKTARHYHNRNRTEA